MTWFFDMRSHSMHFWMTVMLSALLGLLIYLLAALDNPFRGEISIGPRPFEVLYSRIDGGSGNNPIDNLMFHLVPSLGRPQARVYGANSFTLRRQDLYARPALASPQFG